MSARNDAQSAHERLREFYEDAARTHYNEGEVWKGFKFWAMSEVLIDTELSDDEMKSALAIDGRSDLGLDGYFETVDESGPVLTLVQSKYQSSPASVGNAALAAFLEDMPAKLLSPHVVAASPNPLVQDAHRAFLDAIAAGARLRFVFLTNGWLTDEGRVYAEQFRTTVRTFDSVNVTIDFEVIGGADLLRLYESHLAFAVTNTDVTLKLTNSSWHRVTVGDFEVFVGSLPAREIVRAFDRHKYALFRLNPRGPLKNTTNAAIKKTIEDPNKNRMFFLYNNGLTATCESWKIVNDEIFIRDLQIVNGCQTTVTLWHTRSVVNADPEIKVSIRIIEGSSSGIKESIAKNTNTQSRLTAQDFKSNDELQIDLKKQFDALQEPIFYEVKRGDWDVLLSMKGAADRYANGAGKPAHRRVKMKDIAQATLALLGQPGKAKDQSRLIFENSELYATVFPKKIRAAQLLLPKALYEMADELCDGWAETFAGAPYARYALLGLVGSVLCPDGKLPPPNQVAAILADKSPLQQLLAKAVLIISTIQATTDYPGHREFFRSAEHFERLKNAFAAAPQNVMTK